MNSRQTFRFTSFFEVNTEIWKFLASDFALVDECTPSMFSLIEIFHCFAVEENFMSSYSCTILHSVGTTSIRHRDLRTTTTLKMATIPPSLFDTYKQYKAGTIKVTTWLASRAQELNTCTDLFAPSEIKGTGRLKGKARAAKKVVPKEQSHQIPLSAIPRIAKAIANIKAQEVPGIIIRTLEDVIAARSACNECFK